MNCLPVASGGFTSPGLVYQAREAPINSVRDAMTVISEPAISNIQSVRDVAARWEDAWNRHDAEAVAALCSEGLEYDEPALGETAYGREPIADFVRQMAASFPDYVFELQGLYAEVSRSAMSVAWRFRGSYFKTGHVVEFHGDDRLEIGTDGLIHRYRCLYDYRFVLQQMAPESAATTSSESDTAES